MHTLLCGPAPKQQGTDPPEWSNLLIVQCAAMCSSLRGKRVTQRHYHELQGRKDSVLGTGVIRAYTVANSYVL